MKNLKLLILGLLLLCPQFAFAQSNIRNPCYTTNGSNCIPDGTSTPHPVQLYSNGVPVSISLDGSLSVNTPANPQFTDLFSSTLDTTTNWTTNNSGGTTATSAGSLVISGTTTLSQYAGLATKQSWTPAGISPEIFGVVAIFNTLAVPNTTRIFGVYTSPATPTLAAPITDGYVFRLDASGTLFAEIWSAGVVAASSNITSVTGCAPSATVPNLYYFTYRTNLVQFGCGNNPSAFITFVNPSNQTLPISAYSIAGLTNPSSAATMTLTGLSLSSQSGASVKSAGQAPTVNDSAVVVTISPSSPGSGGGAVFGPTASGSASANPPVQIGGTITGAAGANVAGAAVKPASTAAVATDTSLVTQLNPNSPGIIALGQTTKSASIPVTIATDQYVDPCQSPNIAKSSVPINITTATTTSLVGVSGSTVVYVCGVSITVSEVITTPNTILFEYGTGATCTSPVALTGKYGDGGVTAGIPIVVNASNGGTVFKSAASNGVCALTAIGATASFQGVMTYVQQ